MTLKDKFLLCAVYSQIPADRLALYTFFQKLIESGLSSSLSKWKWSFLSQSLPFLSKQLMFQILQEQITQHNLNCQADFILKHLLPQDLQNQHPSQVQHTFSVIMSRALSQYQDLIRKKQADFELDEFFKKRRLKFILDFYHRYKQEIYIGLVSMFLFSLMIWLLTRSWHNQTLWMWIQTWWRFLRG